MSQNKDTSQPLVEPTAYDENKSVGTGGWTQLPKEHLPENGGGWGNPEVQAKAQATKKANAEAKKKKLEVLEEGFDQSLIGQVENQKALLDAIFVLSMDPNESASTRLKAAGLLISQGAFNAHRTDKKDDDDVQTEEVSAKDAMMYLKQRAIETKPETETKQ